MKKLFILWTAILLITFSTSAFAQSTGVKPAPGATHSYYITPGNAGNTISWSVTKGNLTAGAGTDVIISDASASNTDIAWAEGLTVGDWYYVHVIENDGSCTNEKVLPVQITASPFYLTIAAAADNQCYDGAVTASIDGTDPGVINYDHGTATLVFTVAPNGLSSSYNGYSFNIDLDFNSYSGTLDASNVSVTSGNGSITGGTVTITNNQAVTISYEVDNQTIFSNGSDVDAQDFTATATISDGETSNGIDDNGSGTKTDNTNVSRPNTSGIGTN